MRQLPEVPTEGTELGGSLTFADLAVPTREKHVAYFKEVMVYVCIKKPRHIIVLLGDNDFAGEKIEERQG